MQETRIYTQKVKGCDECPNKKIMERWPYGDGNPTYCDLLAQILFPDQDPKDLSTEQKEELIIGTFSPKNFPSDITTGLNKIDDKCPLPKMKKEIQINCPSHGNSVSYGTAK